MKQQSAVRHIDRYTRTHYPYSETNQYSLLLIKAAWLAEKQQILNYRIFLPESTIYHTRGEHVNHYTTDAVIHEQEIPIFDIHLQEAVVLQLYYGFNICVLISSSRLRHRLKKIDKVLIQRGSPKSYNAKNFITGEYKMLFQK